MGEYGRVVYDIVDFGGFRNYRERDEELVDVVNGLYMYLKFSGEVKYFEYCDYKQSFEEYDGYDPVVGDDDEDYEEEVWNSWVIFGFDDVDGRKFDDEWDHDDLMIAIDRFENGSMKLRINCPVYCVDRFNEYYRGLSGSGVRGYFESEKESEFVSYIRALFDIV